MSLLEKDKIMLQHKFTEYQRKADQEAEKRRYAENEGKNNRPLLMHDSEGMQMKDRRKPSILEHYFFLNNYNNNNLLNIIPCGLGNK